MRPPWVPKMEMFLCDVFLRRCLRHFPPVGNLTCQMAHYTDLQSSRDHLPVTAHHQVVLSNQRNAMLQSNSNSCFYDKLIEAREGAINGQT